LKVDQEQQLGKLQNKHAAEIMRLAKARVDMWEVFLKKLEVITQASAHKSKDLDTKPAPITTDSKEVKNLKARWDKGAFDDQIKTCSSSIIAALDMWLRDTERKRSAWITTRRAAELQVERVKAVQQGAAGDGDDGKADVPAADAPTAEGELAPDEWGFGLGETLAKDSGVGNSAMDKEDDEEKADEPDGDDEPPVRVTRSQARQQQEQPEEHVISPVKPPVDNGNAAALAGLPQPRVGRRVGSKNRKNYVVLAPPDLTSEQMADL
jgi:hypothetical protein